MKRLAKRFAFYAGILFACSPLTHEAFSQSATASLRGVVTDATRAVVPGAEVVVTSTDTAQQHAEHADGHGEFSFQELFVGDYRVEVRSPGFATWVNSSIHLDVGNQSQITVQLAPASSQQAIEVTAEATRLQTNEIAQGAVVSDREIAALPLSGRNFAQLGILQPGVRPASASLMVMGGFRRAGQNYEVNGQRPESNNFLIDGMRDNQPAGCRLRVSSAGGCDCRVPHPYGYRPSRVWRHQRRHHHHRYAIRNQQAAWHPV